MQTGHERLTNSRYADDILLYAKSLHELTEMLELLQDELAAVGLEMHENKTKILTSCLEHHYHFVDIGNMMIEILPSEKAHKYLGRMLSLNPDEREAFEVRNRLRAAWAKFHQHRRWLLNRHVSLHLRLRLFAAVVSPCALFAAMVLPLTKHDLEKFAVTQRKMLRSIVGWLRVPDEA